MQILISFMPWFLFWILAFYKKMELAAAGLGLATALAIIIKNRREGRSINSLQKGTVVFFFLFALAVLVFGKEAVAGNVDLLGNSAVLVIVFITIIFRRPFVLEFLRERAGNDFREDKHALRLSYIVSWLWFAVLLLNLGLVAARHFSLIEINRGLSIAIRIFNCIAAAKISLWYLKKENLRRALKQATQDKGGRQ